VSDSLRDRAAAGAAKLKRYGDHEEAAAIEAFLAPGGWVKLRDSENRGELVHVSFSMSAALKAALEKASDELASPLPALAEQAYRAVLETDWRPPRIGRTPRERKAVLNFKVDAALRSRVREALVRLTEEAGYRVTESSVVVSWMCEELGVDRASVSAAPSGEPAE
jgi:hypothetical protein